MERVEELLKAPVTIIDDPNGKKLDSFRNNIEFRKCASPTKDVTILENINLVVGKGRTIALVGSSGAGKSTLADLVPRFHDVTSGELLIDGVISRTIPSAPSGTDEHRNTRTHPL